MRSPERDERKAVKRLVRGLFCGINRSSLRKPNVGTQSFKQKLTRAAQIKDVGCEKPFRNLWHLLRKECLGHPCLKGTLASHKHATATLQLILSDAKRCWVEASWNNLTEICLHATNALNAHTMNDPLHDQLQHVWPCTAIASWGSAPQSHAPNVQQVAGAHPLSC